MSRIFKIFSIIIVFIFLGINCKEQQLNIKTISTFDDARNELNNVDSKTLVLFDVDDTLVTQPDFITKACYFPAIKWELLYSYVWANYPRVLIEQQVVDIINNLKKKGAYVLALTHMESGSFGVVESIPKWRYKRLKQNGITFSANFRNMIFENFPMYEDSKPLLYKGILFANKQDKGSVLEAFLKRTGLKPSRILFFDDLIENLQSVSKVCKKRRISCLLFNYRGTKIVHDFDFFKQVRHMYLPW